MPMGDPPTDGMTWSDATGWQMAPPMNGLKDPRDVMLDLAEGGLLLLLDAVKAGDPKDEIIWRIEEELRQIRRRI